MELKEQFNKKFGKLYSEEQVKDLLPKEGMIPYPRNEEIGMWLEDKLKPTNKFFI